MGIPRDVFECGRVCFSSGPAEWPELFLIGLLLSVLVYSQIRHLTFFIWFEKWAYNLMNWIAAFFHKE